MSHGPVPPGARVAVSQLAPDGAGNWTGWVAVVAGGSVELVRHNMAHPLWRSGTAALPLRDPLAVPRFPDRGHAVFLATGAGPGGPALAGLVAPPGTPMGKVWSVPLRAQPTLSACAFMATGAISLLLVSQDGKETRLSRIDVDDSGKVTSPERVVRTTGRRVLAVTADVRAGSPLSFLILEADQNRLALGTIPLVGEARFPEPTPLPGWPAVPAEVDLEVAMNGTVLLAVIDAQGNLYGGTPSDGLEPAGARVSQPRAVAIYKGVVYSGFTDKGYLFRPTR
jgi:hypothetical protein